VIVVLVGEFHKQYGGGLDDRLKARVLSSVMSISQVNTSGLNSEEIKEAIMPHPEYGPRADWIWAAPAVE
ncbi:MAG: iron-regulated protein, partial [Bdellovibrionales bacterium]